MPMDDILAELFVAARGPHNDKIAVVSPDINLMQVGHRTADGHTADQLREEMEQAVDLGGWVIYMIHGVGDWSHNRHIDADEHRRWVAWLGDNGDRVWVAPFVEVARHVRDWLDRGRC